MHCICSSSVPPLVTEVLTHNTHFLYFYCMHHVLYMQCDFGNLDCKDMVKILESGKPQVGL